MTEQKSFKERVKETVIQNAYSYKRYFVNYEYLLCSEDLLSLIPKDEKSVYIIS